jgi:UDP-N-acetylmuramoylalanine--D-glutamate ligase
MRTDRVIGKSIGIIGAARSGVSAALLLKRYNANVFVSESRDAELVLESTQLLEANGIEYETGGNTDRVFRNRDYIVVSPGVPATAPIIRQIEDTGIPIISEIELGFWMCDGQIIAITGSNGKTTTTTLTGEIFKHSGRTTFVAGNIGSPFCDICNQVPKDGWAVLEISSFQLERCFEFKPDIAVVLNLTPDHLDRYEDFASYVEMKMRISENQDKNDTLIVNHDDTYLMSLSAATQAKKYYFSLSDRVSPGAYVDQERLWLDSNGDAHKLLDVADISLPGPHNLANCAAAAVTAVVAGIDEDAIRDVLSSFESVEHRLEDCGEIGKVKFTNDSKATNVDSVWYALQSVQGKIVIIMGGRDKGGDFTRLRGLVSEHVVAVVLIGEASDKIEKAFEEHVPMHRVGNMNEAVRLAHSMAMPGNTVLLSPGCASFDMYRDYEHRGRAFKEAIAGLRKEIE